MQDGEGPVPDSTSRFYFPDTLNDLLHDLRSHPGALIYGGGTYILKQQRSRTVTFPPHVISLQEVEDLDRVSRTERHLEVGSMVSIKKLLLIGKNVIPEGLYTALEQIAPPAIKNLATLGGNICVREYNMTSATILQLMDVGLELRRLGGSRWVSSTRFRLPDGRLDLAGDEVLTRIRIPLDTWNIQMFHRFGNESAPETNPLTFCGLASTGKGIVGDVRIGIGTSAPFLARNREIEAGIVGRKLPLSDREITQIVARYGEAFASPELGLDAFQRKRSRKLMVAFLTRLAEE